MPEASQLSCPPRAGVMLVICAPSGAGKTTLIRRLREEFPCFGYSVSCTTRAPRPQEVDGEDYHFISEETFCARRAAGFFAECATVHGHFYGTPREPVRAMLAQGRDMLFDIDVQGAAQLRLSLVGGAYVFLFPPSMRELERRLRALGTEDAASIRRRLEGAEREMREAHWFDAWIVNEDLDRAYDELRAAFLAATLDPRRRPSLATSIVEGWEPHAGTDCRS